MIREGKREDIPAVLELIKELAVFEKAGDQVDTTVESMLKDGFGENPIFEFFVAEDDGKVVGVSLYYFRYSTWKGKRLYLEDLIVTESHRKKGLGKALFERTGKKAFEENCSGMVWQVLDWNQEAIDFYKSYGADLDNEWINCSIESTKFDS